MWAVNLAPAHAQIEAMEDESRIEAEHEAELLEAQVHRDLLRHPQDCHQIAPTSSDFAFDCGLLSGKGKTLFVHSNARHQH